MARRAALHDTKSVIQILEEDGGVIVWGFSSAEDIYKVNADAEPYLKAIVDDVSLNWEIKIIKPGQGRRSSLLYCPDVLVPSDILGMQRLAQADPIGTVRCSRLFGRSTTAREKWLQQPVLITIIDYFLRTKSISYNSTDAVETGPILSTSATMDIWPGQVAQKLHRDDFIWHQTHSPATVYQVGRDVGLGVLVAGVDTKAANGATLFVPKSHLWGHEKVPTEDQAVAAELKIGEAFIFLSSVAHAGGANKTDKSRTVHGFFFCRAYIRPEVGDILYSEARRYGS